MLFLTTVNAVWNYRHLKHLQKILKYLRIFLFIICIFPSLSQPIEAKIGESLEFAEDEPLNISAESLIYLADDHLFVAEGFVEITYRTARLTADYVEFNEITGNALAIGNVVYEEDGETITADQADFNLDSELGIVNMGDLSLADDNYITGREIEKIGEETYLVKKGTYTACDSSRPAWQFRSSRAKVHQGEYLQAWHTVGYIKGIPVFYFPYFVFPIKTERQTGFLVPDIGRSTSNGWTIENAFFWTLSKSQDITLTHTYYENRGHLYNLEYRYVYTDDTEGNLEVEYIRDKSDATKKKRLEWYHKHGLPYSIKGLINLDLTSDDQFDEDFETDLNDRTNTQLESDISLTKNFSQHTVRLSFERLEDLREESDRVDQEFPVLKITSQKQQFFGTPLYIQQTTEASYLKRDDKEGTDLEFGRIDFKPTLSLPLNLIGQALTVTPSVLFRETYYTRDATTASDTSLDAESTHREYYRYSLGVSGPKFNRIFDFGTTHRVQKLKHLIEPTLSFYYIPSVDNNNLPKFDSIDRIGSSNQSRYMSYGITQRLLTKRVKKNDWNDYQDDDSDLSADELDTETQELASLTISQSYDFEEEEYNFSNISATLKTEPYDDYDLTVRLAYDVYVNAFVTANIDLEGTLWDYLDFEVTWRRSLSVDRDNDDITDVNQFIDFETDFDLLNDRLSVSYSGRYNIEDHERVEDNFGLIYTAQCWDVKASYVQQLVSGERDTGFNILFELKHLGKLFEIKG